MSTQPFDLTGPLPEGLLAIEASAGTGKTFTLSALVTRLIAEAGIAASELLIVTFTRAATSELRSRVRQQLVDTAATLRVDEPHDDLLLAHLADASPEERALRCERMERAVSEFDTATVTTIHGFATQVLGTLGVTAGTDLDATLVDDAEELLDSVCSDVLAAAAVTVDPTATLPTLSRLTEATKIAARIPEVDLVPTVDEPGTDPSQRLTADLVRRCVEVIHRRRRRAGTLSFDDVLSELRDALRGSGAQAVIGALRQRFRAALIDEFQDTDPVQWDIFSTLFGSDDGTRLILVGDPKQAIYSFRGADIATYTDAVTPRPGLVRRSLTTNWRADGAVVGSLNTLFDGVTFGSDDIAYTDVTAAQEHEHLRVEARDGSPLPSLAIRLALGSDLERTTTPKADPNLATDAARRAIFGDLAVQVRELLDDATLPSDDDRRPIRPSDIAVLVRTTKDATKVQAALLAQGIPAVLTRGGSVLDSEAATQWRWLLDALLRPSDATRARTFALSWFGGLDAVALDQLTDEATVALQEQLRTLADTLADDGVNKFVQRVWRTTGVSTRVLARANGDRDLTDLQHIAELLVAAHPDGRASTAGLLAVLDDRGVAAADTETDNDVLARRVESDQQAVQIMTVWVAKGLEFPIVCCPTLWSEMGNTVLFHSPDTGRRTFDVTGAGGWPDKAAAAERKERARVERMYENLRLAYVALTRARHHTILWWTRTQGSSGTAAARLLFARADGRIDHETFTDPTIALPADDDALDVLQPLVDASGATISASMHGRPHRQIDRWTPLDTAASDNPLEVARLDRALDRSACRWSFTAVTNRTGTTVDGPATDGQTTAGDADERIPGHGDVPDPGIGEDAPLTFATARAAPFAALPAGAEIGTLVHAVLERTDFAAVDLDEALDEVIGEELAWRFIDLRPDGVDGASGSDGRTLLQVGLTSMIETPLGTAFGATALRSLRRVDRIDEMPFEIRLAGSGSPATDRTIGALVAQHLTAEDPLRPWAQSLAAGRFDVRLAGHLTGSIDLVARIAEGSGDARFVVVDYKTNRLHRRGRLPEPGDYGRAAMARAMAEHHYPLQALLYSVALHRYLRWRLPGYDPTTHLGGAGYLFLRGMVGRDTPVHDTHPDGVFHWAIPPALVVELSDLLDGGHDSRRRR